MASGGSNPGGAGGAAGSGGAGGTGPGGAAGMGAAGGAGAVCGEAGTSPTSLLGSSGASCAAPGALACDRGDAQSLLICSGGSWTVTETCGSNQRCDRSTASCADILTECAGHPPGFATCADDSTLHLCGPDLVTVASWTCCGRCRAGACEAALCGNGKIEGNETCDDGNSNAADGCEPNCSRTQILQLAAGRAHTCALLSGGNVRCWGANDRGQLGLGVATDRGDKQPFENAPVALGVPAVSIVAGGDHTCALTAAGALLCWGDNARGQLGLGTTNPIGDNEVPSSSVATVKLGLGVQRVSAGGNSTCAILEDGSARCWGENDLGQLGLGHTFDIGDNELPSASVATVSLGASALLIATGGNHACAILEGGHRMRCWGKNGLGQLGLGTTQNVGDDELPTDVPPVDFPSVEPMVNIVAGASRTCSVIGDGTAYCWGDNSDGGLGVTYIGADPTRSATGWGIWGWDDPTIDFTAGGVHMCVELANDDLRCWGVNDKGQLGQPNTSTVGDNESSVGVPPIALGTGANGFANFAKTTSAGARHTCTLLASGEVRCWGANESGQLGLGYKSPPPTDYVGGTPATVPSKLGGVRVLP